MRINPDKNRRILVIDDNKAIHEREPHLSGEFAGRCTQEQIMRCAAFESSPATTEEQAG